MLIYKMKFPPPAQTPSETSCSLALETSSTFRLAPNYQIHHKELWSLPVPSSGLHLHIRELLQEEESLLPDKQHSAPSTLAFLASQSQQPARRLLSREMGPRDASRVKRRLRLP